MRLPNWIGDLVMATPALAALRAHWPDARLTGAGPGHARPLLAGLDLLDEVVVLPPRRGGGPGALAVAARRLAAGHHDAAVLLTNSFSSALVVALAGVPRRAGYAGGGRGLLLTDRALAPAEAGRHRRPVPMVQHYLTLLARLGVPSVGTRTRLATTPDEEARAAAWLERHGLADAPLRVGVHPGASYGPSKLWEPERFATVADALHARHGAATIVFCGPTEQALARRVAAAARGRVVAAADDPLDLGAVKAVVRGLDLLISTDAGPRHLGPAFDVPTVVLMGPTDPRFTNTNLHSSLVVRMEVACSPCQLRHCPIDHRCMTRLLPEHVLAAAERLLARRT